MSAAASGLVGPWGDRTYLLPKSMAYVLSLYLRAEINGRYLTVRSQDSALWQLFGESVVTMPEGLRCDLPTGDLAGGTGEVGTPDDPTSVALELRLQLQLNQTEKLLLSGLGVVNFDGGLGVFRSSPAELLTGRAFIATRHETDSPTFRWFNRRQLFGFGLVRGVPDSKPREIEISFDLYASA
ncbi:MAG TPA: hypothetical protein VHG72_16225 [Polyangia bacterium]|nr:hypothetical protein [Polyangia bacterium]